MPQLLLVLDDDRNRLRGFEDIFPRLGKDWTIKAWRDAPGMIAEVDRYLPEAGLISLDHDLYRDAAADPDPGSGRMVADHLSRCKPACPVIVHSTNTDAAWGMHNALRAGGWTVELVHQLNQPAWIEELWLPAALRLAASNRQAAAAAMPGRLALSEYRRMAASLPAPTPLQVRQFAEYVAGAHSWYKHLRLLPAKAPLQIFVDPAAGMQRTQASDGSVTVAHRDQQGFHYSWLPTDVYRERFGHLAFSKSSGSSVSLTTAGGEQQVANDDAPRVYDSLAGASYLLPEEALTAGRAFISAIVHESASWKDLWQDVIDRTERFDSILETIDGLEVGKRILDRCRELKEDPSRAEPTAALEGEAVRASALAAFDLPLHRLVEAERRRQVEGIATAATRVLKLLGLRR
jgi:hypothetical protein